MSFFRGWLGEKKTALSMWLSLNKKDYIRFHGMILPSSNGTTQIDHVLVSRYGLFIVETKNKSGWIFGSADQDNWTQTLRGKKYPFQNPLRQAHRQKKVLSQFLEVSDSRINTVIYFVGDSKFKTEMPTNVLSSGLGRYIKSFHEKILTENEFDQIVNRLTIHANESDLSSSDHLRSLYERHNSTTTCPKCGSSLRLKEARTGTRAGQKFLGCDSFPRCRFTKSA